MSDLLKAIGSCVHLDHQGKNYVGFCPLHSEKTPSFTVTPEQGYAMRNVKVGIGLDALHKIQALASAAGFLTSSADEEQLCLELIELIEKIAREAVEAENG